MDMNNVYASANIRLLVGQVRIMSLRQFLLDKLTRSIRHPIPLLKSSAEMEYLHFMNSFQSLPQERRVSQSDASVLPSIKRMSRNLNVLNLVVSRQ